MCRTAVILVGGAGKRLKSYTEHLPKSLLPIRDTPLLEIILKQLSRQKFERIILTTHHQSNLIRDFCGDGSKWGLFLEYTREEKPLGTIGPLKIIPDLPENFLVMNGDLLTDLNFKTFYDWHVQGKNLFTVGSYEYIIESQYGVLEIENQQLISFREKPLIKQMINMGIYMANRKILDYIPQETFFGLNDLMGQLIEAKQPISAFCHAGKWIDIGTPAHYQQAQSMELFEDATL